MYKVTLITVFTVLVSSLLTGCGRSDSQDEFVDFRETEPAQDQTSDAEERSSATSDSAGSEAESTDSVNGTFESGGSEAKGDPDPQSPAVPVSLANGSTESSSDTGADPDSGPDVVDSGTESSTDATGSADASPLSAQEELAQLMEERAALLGGAGGPQLEPATDKEPQPVKLLIPDKRFRKERGSDAVRVSYDDIDLLKVLNMDPVPTDAVSHFPDWLSELDGKRVRIRGFMFPTYEASGITRFTMARDNGICCFVRKPKIYDIIDIQLAEGEETDYIEGRPFDVEGIFRIEPEADETELYRLYKIDNAKVLR